MKIQLCYDDGPDDCVRKINELLKEHRLWICTTEEDEDDDSGCVAYEVLTLKPEADANI